jgi:hypothetical protein
MNLEQQRRPIPKWYWIVSVVALLWNLMGFAVFLTDVFAQEMAIESTSGAQKEWAREIPSWVYFVFAISVTTGVAGSICLLIRKAWAIPLFAISVIAVVIQMDYTILIAGGLQVNLEADGPPSLVMPTLVIVFACGLLWFSRFAKGRSWLV